MLSKSPSSDERSWFLGQCGVWLPLETWLSQQWEVVQFLTEGTGIRG